MASFALEPAGTYGIVVLTVDLRFAQWEARVRAAAAAATQRLYVVVVPSLPASRATLDALRRLFDAASAENPTLDVVPVGEDRSQGRAWGAVDAFVDTALAVGLAVPASAVRVRVGPRDAEAVPADLGGGDDAPSTAPLATHAALAVGGTFDRLHAGHRLLLSAACVVAADAATIYAGIAGDALLAKKKHADLLEPFLERSAAAVSYVARCRPDVTVLTSALLDPSAPPKAATMASITALVLSVETIPGGERLLAMRAERLGPDAPTLDLVAVGLVGAESQAPDAPKLGSSGLRAAEAARRAAAG